MPHPFAPERALFPILASKAQLSSCSQSALAQPVAQAIQDYLQGWSERGMDWMGWMTAVNDARAEFARLINARPEDIAVLSSVSDAASAIASALDFGAERNGIVVSEIDFPSVGHVWLAQERKGAQVRFVPADEGFGTSVEAYAAAIDARTRLVSVSHVAYGNGFRQDVASIARLAHAQGALVFVDAYQSAGAMRIDVQREPVDMLAAGAQKFLLGCPGIAFLYVRPEVAATLLPANTGWFGRVDPFAFDIRRLDFAPGACRFQTGTPPMINSAAAAAGLRLLNGLDMGQVEAWLRHLSEVALAEVRRSGLVTASPTDLARKGANTAVRVRDAATAEKALAAQGYVVSARNDVIRVAPHFYNTEEEVVGALRALARLA
ncbi:MAG TPA: aminotransferase class V-fold PLP-dependent enzyme [Ramlibacter sp.]|nr:aminotransferase class V-fold PLP-dependent enzyme [Ramlibacter sp.]